MLWIMGAFSKPELQALSDGSDSARDQFRRLDCKSLDHSIRLRQHARWNPIFLDFGFLILDWSVIG
jgi:hypothetical protein